MHQAAPRHGAHAPEHVMHPPPADPPAHHPSLALPCTHRTPQVVTNSKPDSFTPTIITQTADYLYVEYEVRVTSAAALRVCRTICRGWSVTLPC